MTTRSRSLAIFALVVAGVVSLAQDSPKPTIEALIQQLGADEFQDRERAVELLVERGEETLPALQKATTSDDPEIAQRAVRTIVLVKRSLAKETRRFVGHTDQIVSVAFSPDGRRCASGGFDHVVRVWNVETGEELARLKGHDDIVFSVAFSPDGRSLVSTSGGERDADGKWTEGDDWSIRVWDLETREEVHRFPKQRDWALAALWSPDGSLIATSTRNADPDVRLWNAKTFKQERVLVGHQLGVRGMAFSPDGKFLATSGYDESIRIWNVATGRMVRVLTGHGGWIDRVVFSSKGDRLLSASRDNTCRLWNVDSGEPIRTFAHEDHALSVGFCHEDTQAVSCGGDAIVRVWDLKTGREVYRYEGHAGVIDALAVSPDGKFALTGSKDRTVRLWRLPD